MTAPDTNAIRARIAGLDGFTPGSWRLSDVRAGHAIEGPTGRTVAAAHEQGLRDAGRQTKSNARLIAAAPDMHATILTLCDALEAERAENERLREALEWVEEQRVSAEERSTYIRAPEDPAVKMLCERFGYGAVMDSASRQWIRKDPRGAFYIGGCVGDRTARAALSQKEEG